MQYLQSCCIRNPLQTCLLGSCGFLHTPQLVVLMISIPKYFGEMSVPVSHTARASAFIDDWRDVGLVVQDLETLRKLLPFLSKAPASNGNGSNGVSSSPTNGHTSTSNGSAHQASKSCLTLSPPPPPSPTPPPPPPPPQSPLPPSNLHRKACMQALIRQANPLVCPTPLCSFLAPPLALCPSMHGIVDEAAKQQQQQHCEPNPKCV